MHVVTPRPLTLKSPTAPGTKPLPAQEFPVASILVDNGVFHLDEPYEYLIPEHLSDLMQVGVRVSVPFNRGKCEGLVISRTDFATSVAPLKFIEKIISPYPVATIETIELFKQVSQRWAGTTIDVLRSAIPPRSAGVEREVASAQFSVPKFTEDESVAKELLNDEVRLFWALPPDPDPIKTLASLIIRRSSKSQVLAILSDEKELEEVGQGIDTLIGSGFYSRLDSAQERSARYRDYLLFTQGKRRIALGLRGAIFTPLVKHSTIIVSHESSAHLYEPRAPRWNARDVALLRAGDASINLILTGFSPSLEVGRLLDVGWLNLLQAPSVHHVVASEPKYGELIPSQGFSIVRSALKKGPVLFLIPSKGYGNAILCARCRNLGLCQCGGRLMRKSSQALPQCSLCAMEFAHWRCGTCGGERIYLASRGIERFAEEIGSSFSNYPVVSSFGEHILLSVEAKPQLVLATPGAQPLVKGGYSAVILLEGHRFFGHASLRADERAREQFFSFASLATSAGSIYISMQPAHPIVAALTRWNPLGLVRRELIEREELGLPPYRRFIRLDVSGDEAQQIFDGISHAKSDSRLPQSLEIRPPTLSAKNRGLIYLSVPFEDGPQVTSFLQEYQKRRSISKKELLIIHVDPYELT